MKGRFEPLELALALGVAFLGASFALQAARWMFVSRNAAALERAVFEAVAASVHAEGGKVTVSLGRALDEVRRDFPNLRGAAVTTYVEGRETVVASTADRLLVPDGAKQLALFAGGVRLGNLYYSAAPVLLPAQEALSWLAALAVAGAVYMVWDQGRRLARSRARLREERALRERERVWVDLARKIGHDLSNTLAAADMALENLSQALSQGSPGADLPRLLARLRSAHDALRHEVEVYRDIGHLAEPRFEQLCLDELVKEETAFQAAFREGARFRVEAQPCGLWAEPRLLRVCLVNLLDNAHRAVRLAGGGEVVAGCRPFDGGAALWVSDTGVGLKGEDGKPMSPARARALFTGAFAGKASGEGYGLHWVRAIVEDVHGGAVAACGRPSGGAVFVCVLPARGGAVAPGAAESLAEELCRDG